MCRQILVELPIIKFHANPFSGSRGVTCRQTDAYGEPNTPFLYLPCELA
jgi:hypothetical protein